VSVSARAFQMSEKGAYIFTFVTQQSGTLSAALARKGMPGARVDLKAWETIEVRAMPNESCTASENCSETTMTSCTDRDTCC
jgi:hypothetical protein